jgi:hypothetical protein
VRNPAAAALTALTLRDGRSLHGLASYISFVFFCPALPMQDLKEIARAAFLVRRVALHAELKADHDREAGRQPAFSKVAPLCTDVSEAVSEPAGDGTGGGDGPDGSGGGGGNGDGGGDAPRRGSVLPDRDRRESAAHRRVSSSTESAEGRRPSVPVIARTLNAGGPHRRESEAVGAAVGEGAGVSGGGAIPELHSAPSSGTESLVVPTSPVGSGGSVPPSEAPAGAAAVLAPTAAGAASAGGAPTVPIFSTDAQWMLTEEVSTT